MCEETGGDVWLGGLAVAQYLCREGNVSLVRGKRVVELGAGTGYLSLCAAMLGADNVVATDLPMMVNFIKSQISRNIELMQEKESEKAKRKRRSKARGAEIAALDEPDEAWRRLHRVSVVPLDWEQPVSDEVLAICSCDYFVAYACHLVLVQVKAQLMSVDVVLATDLLYQCSNVAPLLGMLQLICSPGTIVIVGQSHRCDEDEEKFFAEAKEKFNFSCKDLTDVLPNAMQVLTSKKVHT
jgi:predicted nicotinamide N-methyase